MMNVSMVILSLFGNEVEDDYVRDKGNDEHANNCHDQYVSLFIIQDGCF